jgi:hypothetical protein
MSLIEAVQICRGTDWGFRRQEWPEDIYVKVAPTPSNDNADLVFDSGRSFLATSGDVLANDYEIVQPKAS